MIFSLELDKLMTKIKMEKWIANGPVFGNSICWLYFYFSSLTSNLLLLGLITLNMLKNKLLLPYIFMIWYTINLGQSESNKWG